jgi:CRP-like cAMP-binding protein
MVLNEALQLKQVPLFSTLDSAQLKLLAFTCEIFDYADQHYLCTFDQPSDCVFVILDGLVDVVGKDEDGREVLLSTQSSNSLIGEMGVLSGTSRTASVRARQAVTALRIPSDRFLKLVTENPQVALHVMRDISIKLADTSRRAASLQTRIDNLEQR